MPELYEYTIQMNDKASGTLQKLTGSSFEAVQKFVQLEDKTSALKRSVGDFGNSIGTLKQKIDLLQQERELLDPKNLTTIRQYNKEIASLNKTINKLETDTGGSKLSKNFKDAFQQIPGASMLTNPLVLAGAGVAAVGKLGMDWETGMAKINTTARLSENDLDKLGSTIKKMGVDAGGDLMKVPIAYEKILSQTNNVALSTDILGTSLKGAKAGFTDIDIVAGAAAQSLSAIGEGKATAAEVMDTLFAAKRVGAGEFVDFANNIPGLIAAGKNVGVTWKEVSGAFAYMTGQGNNAADSTMLLQNAFSALGKSEITGGLKAAGVAVFDNAGKMRGLADIMTDLSGLTKTMTDQQKSDFFEAIELKDQQAKQAFSNLTNEIGKLQEAMNATGNAAGELQSALDKTNTLANKIKKIWSNITGTGLGLSDVLMAVLNPALDGLLLVFKGIYAVVGWVGTAWNWWTGLLNEGNPIIVGLTAVIGGLSVLVAFNTLVMNAAAIGYGLAATASGIYSAVTWAATAATGALSAALKANPIGAVIVLVIGIAAAVYAAWQKFEGFRKVVAGCWEVAKQFGKVIYEVVIGRLIDLVKGIGKVGEAFYKLFTGDFKGAWQSAKDGFMDMSGMNAAGRAYDEAMKVGAAWEEGKAKGAISYANSHYKENDNGFRITQPVEPTSQLKGAPTADWNSMIYGEKGKVSPLMNPNEKPGTDKPTQSSDEIWAANQALIKKLNGNKPSTKGKKDDTLALGAPQDYNQTNAYSSITSKFGAQVDLAMSGQETNRPENKTEKPIINMASRVEEIAGSLRKIAAVAALPVMMTIGAASTSSATELNPVVNNNHITDVQNMIDAPVANTTNQDKAIYNAFDNRLFQNSQHITDLSQKIDRVDNSTSSLTANTDLSRKVDQSNTQLENSFANSVANTDLSRKINQINNGFDDSVSNNTENGYNNLYKNTATTANSYDGHTITNSDVTNSTAVQSSVANTTNNQSRTVHFDRFTDKIEIHVNGVDASTGSAIAEQIRNEVEKALAEILNV